jgi:hypothetical protein
MSTEIQKFGTVTYIVHQPGNATRYEVIGVKLPTAVPDYGDMWLISFPSLGTSYVFHPGGFITVGYVTEKLSHQRNGLKLGEVDLHEMTKCIALITGGKHNATTDARGTFPLLNIAQ